jgi:hypothetical protein
LETKEIWLIFITSGRKRRDPTQYRSVSVVMAARRPRYGIQRSIGGDFVYEIGAIVQ